MNTIEQHSEFNHRNDIFNILINLIYHDFILTYTHI